VSTAPPAISGIAQQGQTLSASAGLWSYAPTGYTYLWQDCDGAGAGCVPIADATTSSYVVAADDVGATITVVVTATNAGGSATTTSSPSAVVTLGAPVNTLAPTVSGTVAQGATLSADSGTWSGSPVAYSYQWSRCAIGCAAIPAATAATYAPSAGDVGYAIVVVVTATGAGGTTSASSQPTAIVPAVLSAPGGSILPTITPSTLDRFVR
jgi:hypothetical protein